MSSEADFIIQAIKVRAGVLRPPIMPEPDADEMQAKKLAAVLDQALRIAGVHAPFDRDWRMKIYSMVCGREIVTGNLLPWAECRAMLERWSAGWYANDQCRKDIPTIIGQQELPI